MAKLRAIPGGKGKGQSLSLVYGLRLYGPGEVAGIRKQSVTLGDGSESPLTLHLIEGTREQIRAQLLASIDAFFDIFSEEKPSHRSVPPRRRSDKEGNDPGC